MNTVTKRAIIECNYLYQEILDEAKVTELAGSDEQLFINARLREKLNYMTEQKIKAEMKSMKITDVEAIKARNDEILYLASIKGISQKKLSYKFNITQPGINKIIKKTIKDITGCEDNLPPMDLIQINKDKLERYFIYKKLEARHEKRFSNVNNSK